MKVNATQIREPRISANVAGKQVEAEDSQQGFSQQDVLNDSLSQDTSLLKEEVSELRHAVRNCLRALEVLVENLYGVTLADDTTSITALTDVTYNSGTLVTDTGNIASHLVNVTNQGNTEVTDLNQHKGTINHLRDDMADVGTVLNYLFGDVSSVNDTISKTTTSTMGAKDGVETLTSSIGEERLTINNLVKDGAKLRQGAEELVTDISNIKTAVVDLISDVGTIKGELDKAITDSANIKEEQDALHKDLLFKAGYMAYRMDYHGDLTSSATTNTSRAFDSSYQHSMGQDFGQKSGIIYWNGLDGCPSVDADVVAMESSSDAVFIDGSSNNIPPARNSMIMFYANQSTTSTAIGSLSGLTAYVITESSWVSGYGGSIKIKVGDSFHFGANNKSITNGVIDSLTRCRWVSYENTSFYPYQEHDYNWLNTYSPGIYKDETRGGWHCYEQFRAANIPTQGISNNDRQSTRLVDRVIEFQGWIQKFRDPWYPAPGAAARSAGGTETTGTDHETQASLTSDSNNITSSASQPSTSGTTPNAEAFYSSEFSRGTVTVNYTNNEITFSGQEGYISVGDMVLFKSAGTLPSGIKYGNPYYVSAITNSTGPVVLCTVTEPGSSTPIVLNFTDNGSGAHSAYEITMPSVATATPSGAVFRGNVSSVSSNYIEIATVDGGQASIVDGDRVFFKMSTSSNSVPSGITANTIYFVRDRATWNSGLRFKLATTLTGSAISIGSSWTGTLQCYEGTPRQNSGSLGSGVSDNNIRGVDAETTATNTSAYSAPTTTSPSVSETSSSTSVNVNVNTPSTNKEESIKAIKSSMKAIDLKNTLN